jgi:hypothetical protein
MQDSLPEPALVSGRSRRMAQFGRARHARSQHDRGGGATSADAGVVCGEKSLLAGIPVRSISILASLCFQEALNRQDREDSEVSWGAGET